MYKIVVMAVLLVLTACGDARNPKNNTEKNIYRSADKMLLAFRNKDWETFMTYLHPNMIARLGGKDQMARLMTAQMKDVPDSAIKKLMVSRILQVKETPTDVQCIVEQQMMMHLQGAEVTSTTYLVGESLDHGKNWTFFDASNSGVASPGTIKPNLSPELKIPEKKQDAREL
ncbi:hypothetical protein EXU57_18675 [Segetibacter sp. 3557_3]|uniref:hypothetical protein n=1 Tax=Segetibacter sp. 3557_3 TaxID=2547429 RepID=UPI001058859A|nr:hypothetical protein [Segetibacter sp. 3557_3]TDH23078.1 hypothetical protein EXU57_18675 [Segetibacter sp. 3557_3]